VTLIKKELWEVVDETEKEPAADAPDTRAWQKKDEKHCNYLPLGQGLGARTGYDNERYINSIAAYTAKAEYDNERYINSIAAYTAKAEYDNERYINSIAGLHGESGV
jgi:hypothetical protein